MYICIYNYEHVIYIFDIVQPYNRIFSKTIFTDYIGIYLLSLNYSLASWLIIHLCHYFCLLLIKLFYINIILYHDISNMS